MANTMINQAQAKIFFFQIFLILLNNYQINAAPEELIETYRNTIDFQNLPTVIMGIEAHLRNLDSIYSIKLTTLLQDKFEQYNRKLEAIDTKIIRLESVIMLNLDNISENISSKHFKDDIAKTNLAKKVDAIYDGIGMRLGYLDRRIETQCMKIQNKLDSNLNQLEQVEQSILRRYDNVQSELSDAVAAIDDLKTYSTNMEENIINITQENHELLMKNEKILLEHQLNNSVLFNTLKDDHSKNFKGLDNKIEKELLIVNHTDKVLMDMKIQLQQDLNEYAVKVGEMNSENWKAGKALQDQQTIIESVINSTKTEVQNGVRALVVLIGKNYKKNNSINETSQLTDLEHKLEANLEKIFYVQKLFLENCYRLQMDESQIESKISDILEKLADTFEKKTSIEIKDIENLEKLIKNHDNRISRNIYEISTNIITIYEKMSKDNKKFENDLEQTSQHLNALFSLIQNTLVDENGSTKNMLLHKLNQIQEKMEYLEDQSKLLLHEFEQQSVKTIDGNMQNITTTLQTMESKINNIHRFYYNNSNIQQEIIKLQEQLYDLTNQQKITLQPQKIIQNTIASPQNNLTKTSDNLTDIIKQIFEIPPPVNNGTIYEENNSSPKKCLQNYRHLIDVRAELPDCLEGEDQQEMIDENNLTNDNSQESYEEIQPIANYITNDNSPKQDEKVQEIS